MESQDISARLHPIEAPFRRDYLNVTDGHRIYFECTGNPAGIPVLFIHGGPGACLSDSYSAMFDTSAYHIIAYEQRGCGRSTPFASLENNTSEDLLRDITALRNHLNIKQWLLFGGSWGATLALLAAIDKPDTVLGLVLRGVFLGRDQDIQWYLAPNGGAAQLYPEHYEAFVQDIQLTPDMKAIDICEAFTQLFSQRNSFLQGAALRSWYGWEERISRIQHPYGDPLTNYNLNEVASLARLECHFLMNNCFIPENFILDNVDKFVHLPGEIVHGRYDIICKLEASYALQQAWPNSQLNVIPDAGHSTSEPSIALALRQATDTMIKLLR